jgi:hypothetical protein
VSGRLIAEMLAAQDRETVRPDDDGADLSPAEKEALRVALVGDWEPDATLWAGETPEDRLRMQDHLTEDYE